MKKALMTASVASMLDNFNRNNIKLLLEEGYEVTLAANFDAAEDSSPLPKLLRFKEEMEALGCRAVQIDFSRKIRNIPKQVRSYRQLQALAGEGFALVHCNSPICAAMTRLAFKKKRKQGTRVIYTAHGFHFYRGAPLKNWLLYFPVEWVCARWTDVLNTVNGEDYRFAKKWLKAGRIVRLPGAGIDLEKFRPGNDGREEIRGELGIRKDETLLLSVGELSRRKNHAAVIKALGQLDASRITYVICGKGELEGELKRLAKRLKLEDKVIFPGYREDISELCHAADLFVFPSLQEGLPAALLEAAATKTPVICSDIRGNRELVGEKELLFNPKRPASIAECIRRAAGLDRGAGRKEKPPEGLSRSSEAVERHYKKALGYRMEKVADKMREEYIFEDNPAGLPAEEAGIPHVRG